MTTTMLDYQDLVTEVAMLYDFITDDEFEAYINEQRSKATQHKED